MVLTSPLTAARVLLKLVEQEQPTLMLLGNQAIDDDNGQAGQRSCPESCVFDPCLLRGEGVWRSSKSHMYARSLRKREIQAHLQ
jgi:hypothetical protein